MERGKLYIYSRLGEVRGWVMMWLKRMLGELRVLILTRYDTHTEREKAHCELVDTLSTTTVCLCICACVRRVKEEARGPCFPQRPIDFCVWCEGGGEGGEVRHRGRVGLHRNPAHSQRTSYGDLWPQHQPTCLEFHYRRGKTDGGHGGLGFWGLTL